MKGFYFTGTATPFCLVAAADNEISHVGSLSLNHCIHEHWVLDYTLTAGGYCRTDQTEWEERSGGVGHLYPPGCVYHEDTRSLSGLHSVWILFDGESALLRSRVGNSAGFARFRDPAGRLQILLQELVRHAVNGNTAYWEACSVFCRIQMLLETACLSGDDDYTYEFNPAGGTETSLGERVHSFLERHFPEKLSIRRIAREFALSESGLSHRYKAECGESIFETLQRIRLEQSMILLQRGDRLKNIASAAGFGSEYYYSRCFRMFYGISPAAWRKRK